MRFSAYLLAAALSASTAVAAPISNYVWSITNFSFDAGSKSVSFQVSGPTGEFDDIPIPAFSLTGPCVVKNDGSTTDCSALIENNTGGQTLKSGPLTIDNDAGTVTSQTTFGFSSGGTSLEVSTNFFSKTNGPSTFTIDGERLNQA
ncbi:hypothetical protein LZ32DRAFT_602293 [Colletotrichum eremochloae]|nr:hypothetical protein LZ32DRAFT_602293 [Colletotrichum eremochloae]